MKFSKSILSQYLRTSCERSLYLSLHSDKDLQKKNLPARLTSRPGVRHLRDAGVELERRCFQRTETAFPARCVGVKGKEQGQWHDQPLGTSLQALPDGFAFLIHPEYELESHRNDYLTNLGVDNAGQASVPPLGSYIPDIVGVDLPISSSIGVDYEVDVTGERIPLEQDDQRRRLTVIDIKHAQEANTSYESEVALYAIALSNWLAAHGLADSYYVSAELSLWTNGGIMDGDFAAAAEAPNATEDMRLKALISELSPINAPIYLQAIRRFFSEQLPRVVRNGDENFEALDWHVCSRCGSCDWLGHRDWLSANDRETIEKNPAGYCFPKAADSHHLSRVPMITRGARLALVKEGVDSVEALRAKTGAEPAFAKHTGLKSDRRVLPAYAEAIMTGVCSIDADRADGGLARYADLDVYVVVNFDAGAGQLTGIGVDARFRQRTDSPGDEADKKSWTEQWIVSAKSQKAEGASVRSFLNKLAEIYEWVRDTDPKKGGARADKTRAQLIFWDQRQYRELCLAVGRHLPDILYGDEERTVKALVWLFPPEEIQERSEAIDARKPGVAFVNDIVRRLVRVPAVHELTLFNVVEDYHYGEEGPRSPDSFYREPLTDAIPRERIYEIWSAKAAGDGYVVRWGQALKDLSQLMDGLRRTIRTQTYALRSVVWKLRGDFGSRLKAEAPILKLTIPNWNIGVAFEAKLWIAWAEFTKAFDDVMSQKGFLSDPEEIEARFDGIRLTELQSEEADGSLVYRVSEESRDSKLNAPDGFLCLSVDEFPGFLRRKVRDVVDVADLPADCQGPEHIYRPLSTVFKVKLLEFDRVNLTARIEWNNFWDEEKDLRSAVVDALGDVVETDVTLIKAPSGEHGVRRLTEALRAIGNPAIAKPTDETLSALGKSGKKPPKGKSPVLPAALALWDATTLSGERIRTPADAKAIAGKAAAAANTDLNPSQKKAIANAASKRLSVIWGPPGTGKTQTCAGLVHQLAVYEASRDRTDSFNMLLTGPNYRAVGNLIERTLQQMAVDAEVEANGFIVYGMDREDRFDIPDTLPDGLNVTELVADHRDQDFADMVEVLTGDDGVNIVVAVAHQCPRITEQMAKLLDDREFARPLFDFMLFDESSQADMMISIPPLILLKDNFQLVLAGDLLQMPPIAKCDPPSGAEFLVGSIQRYFVDRFDVPQEELLVNYRSADEIVQYTKRLGYPAGLEAHFTDAKLRPIAGIEDAKEICEAAGLAWSAGFAEILDPEHRIVAVTYDDGISGQANAFEADCVTSLVMALRHTASRVLENHVSTAGHSGHDDESFWTRGVGVVTPHRAQRAIVIRKLQAAFPETNPDLIDQAVDTVERFQGGERHTIIVSFGVGDPDLIAGEERFLMQLERTNVAVSRAMAKCIVLLSDNIAAHIPTDREALETAHALKGIVDEWCDCRGDAVVELTDGESRPIVVRSRHASN